MKKFLCLVMAAIMVLGMAACKKTKETDKTSVVTKYVEEELGAVIGLSRPGNMQINSQNQPIIQNLLEAEGEPSDSMEQQSTGVRKSEFIVLGTDGKPVKKINCDIEGQVSAFTLDSQDNLYIVSAMPTEAGVLQQLYIADSQGNVQKTINLDTQPFDSQDGYKKTITGIAVDSTGNIYLTRILDSVLVLDRDGKETGTLGEEMYMGTVQVAADNHVILYGNRTSDYQNVLQKFDPVTGKNLWTTNVELRKEAGVSVGETSVIRCDPQDGSIYLLTGDGLEKFDGNGKSMGKVLDFKEHMILASGLQPTNFCIDAEKTFWLLTQDSQISMIQSDQSSPERTSLFKYCLKQVDEADTITLTLSVPASNRMIDVAVSKFNKENPGYQINVKEAGNPNRKGSYDEQYINTLSTELMSGLGPDILSVEGLPYEKYAVKGMLADLSELMKDDTGFSMDDYYTNLFRAMETDGKLFAAPVSVSGIAMLSNRKLFTEKNITFDPATWTWNDFSKMIDPSAGSGIYAITPDTANILLMSAYGRFVDVKNKRASFENGEFEQMLEMAKSFGMDPEKSSNDGFVPLFETASRARVLFSPQVIGDFMILSASKVLLEGEFDVHNMPSPDEAQKGGAFRCNEAFAINGSTRYRDKAWAFIRILLSDEIQSLDELKGFPVRKKALREKVDRNNKLLTADGLSTMVGIGSGEPVSPVALSEEEITRILNFMEGVTVYCHMDNKILDMIQAETASFFSGKKSAADVAKTLQQKVGLYLGE